MKFKNWVIVVGVLGIVILGAFSPTILSHNVSYHGQEVFYSEEEYTQFKNDLISSKATWEKTTSKMEVLSYAPPIIVNFDVDIPYGNNFNYGEKSYTNGIGYIVIAGAVLIACIIFAIISRYM